MLQQTEQGLPPLPRTNAAVVRMSHCPRLRTLFRALERIIRWTGIDIVDLAILGDEGLFELMVVELFMLDHLLLALYAIVVVVLRCCVGE
jgi:hypothetical protein